MTATDHAAAMGAPAGLDHCPLMPTYGPPSVEFVRGSGSRLWDRDGKEYLDLLSGIAVTSLGHAHPEVAEAVAEQARTLLHVSNLFGTVPGSEVALTLDRLMGGGGQVFFSNSGAEANEAAIKLARKWAGSPAGRFNVVSAYGSFHGRTLATLHATGQPTKHEAFQPLPEGFRHVAWMDLDGARGRGRRHRRGHPDRTGPGRGWRQPRDDRVLRGHPPRCVTSGASSSWSTRCRPASDGADSGSPTSTSVYEPDVVTMAKALGNGVPIGACWARRDVAACLRAGRPCHHVRRPAAGRPRRPARFSR